MAGKHEGGTQQRRGALYQDASLLYYLLLRLMDHPDLTFAPESIEDATFHYPSVGVTEYVQCKKVESVPGTHYSGVTPHDEWSRGVVTVGDLAKWTSEVRAERSAVGLLESDPNGFYTALVFARPGARGAGVFVPDALKDYDELADPVEAVRRAFPIDFKHRPEKFAAKKALADWQTSNDVSSRIRLIPTAPPAHLRFACRILLFDHHEVGVHEVDPLLSWLSDLVRDYSATAEVIDASMVMARIEKSRAKGGRWRRHDEVLADSAAQALNRAEPLTGSDLDSKRYADRPEFAIAWEALDRPGGFVAISGAVGTGKTTLCRYVAHRFVSFAPGRSAYFLTAPSPTAPIVDELAFLTQNLKSDTLFIIEDEHMASERAEELIQRFSYAAAGGEATARLLVSSKVNYGRAERLAQGRSTGELRKAIHVALPNRSVETVSELLEEIAARRGLNSDLSATELAKLSDGVLGVALGIARATRRQTGATTRHTVLNSYDVRRQLLSWILSESGLPQAAEDEVVNILVLGAFFLPLTAACSEYIEMLARAGFLEATDDVEDEVVYRVTDLNLSFIFQNHSRDRAVTIVNDYVERFPRYLGEAVIRFSQWQEGKDLLGELVEKQFEALSSQLRGPEKTMTLAVAARVLTAVRRAGVKLYRRWALPFRQPNLSFIPDVFARATSAGELATFLNVIIDLDKSVGEIQSLVEKTLTRGDAAKIRLLLSERRASLADCGRLLHALQAISPRIAASAYAEFRRSARFPSEDARAADEANLSMLLQFCDDLRSIDRAEAHSLIERIFTPERVVDVILRPNASLIHVSFFLLRLERIHPRAAADILSTLWVAHQERLLALLRRESNLDRVMGELYSWARINRLVAVGAADSAMSRLVELLATARYADVGAAIESSRRWISRRIARELCDALDRESVLRHVKEERRYADVVGKFLFYMARACPGVAAWFQERLDYALLLRVAQVPRIRDVVIVVRGFLTAAAAGRRKPLAGAMLSDPALRAVCRRRYDEATSVAELGFALVALTACPFTAAEILRLLSIANPAELESGFRSRINSSTPVIDVANGLYGLARFNPRAARSVLAHYVDLVSRDPDADLYRTRNVVDIGFLLTIASAIDRTAARTIAISRSLESDAEAVRNEPGFGRSAAVVNGLSQASRTASRAMLSRVAIPEIWRAQYERNDSIDSIPSYARVLASVSASACGEFVRFVYREYAGDIVERLRVDANLQVISQWLRMLPLAGAEFVVRHGGRLVQILGETEELDSRLWHLLDCAIALHEAGYDVDARRMASRAVRERGQMRSQRRLADLVQLLNKAEYLQRGLRMSDLTRDLVRDMSAPDVVEIASTERQLLLTSYFQWMATTSIDAGAFSVAAEELKRQRFVVNELEDEPNGVGAAATLILAGGTDDEVLRLVHVTDWEHRAAWEIGIVAMLFSGTGVGTVGDVARAVRLSSAQWDRKIEEGLDEHADNLTFGLTQLPATEMAPSRLSSHAAAERMADETSAVRRFLLDGHVTENALSRKPFHVWIYLADTLLRPTYLDWEQNVETRADALAFNQRYVPDLTAVST